MPTAVVTGAASGIGRALAVRLAATGHRVHLADVVATDELAEELGGVPHRVDVGQPDDMAALAHAAPDARLVCLNAGVVGQTMGAPWEAPPQEWDRLLRINLMGVVNGLRVFVPRLVDAGEPAQILITASLAGLVSFPGGGAYAASKHAVVAVAEQAALALADTEVAVTLLGPALVRSGMSEVGEDPDEVAAAALTATAAGRFLLTPDEWHAAVTRRAEALVHGAQPTLPQMAPTAAPTTQAD
jgi:NAD(P)-dependent dehydrogenase (short-subunit alcohol dehydrogenase family)